jgi:hypothetical protein
MTKYKLTNKRIGSETIQMLEDKLLSLIDNTAYVGTDKLSVFKNSIQIIKDYQPYNSNIHLNSALRHKKIAYGVAIFCILGLNPDAAIEIRKQHHSAQTRSSNNILMHMLDTDAIHKLVDDFAKCEGDPKAAVNSANAIHDLLQKNILHILDEPDSSTKSNQTPKRRYSTEKKQELINELTEEYMKKDPSLNKSDIARLLIKNHFPEIRVGFDHIRREFLPKCPSF